MKIEIIKITKNYKNILENKNEVQKIKLKRKKSFYKNQIIKYLI